MAENLKTQNAHLEDEQSQERELNIKDILSIFLRRKYGILFIILVSVSLAWLQHWIQPPEYHAVSFLMINNSTSLLTPEGYRSEGTDERALTKDVVLLHSTPIAELAVRELIKTSRRDSLELFGNRKFKTRVESLLPDSFTNTGKESKRKSFVGSQYSEQWIRQYANELSGRIKVETVPETNLLKVSVASPFQDEAVILTNTLLKVYRDTDINRSSEKYTQVNKFIAQLMRDQEQLVTEADKALSKYMAENQIYEPTGNVQQLLGKLTEIDAKYKDIQAEYHISQNSLGFLENKLTEADKELSSRIARNVNAKLGSILDDIKARETEYLRLVTEKGADNAECKTKKQQLDVVKSRYEQISRSKIAGEIGYAGRAQKYNFDFISEKLQAERKLNLLSFSANEISRLKRSYEDQIRFLPKKQQEYAKLQRDRDVVGKTYVFLKEKLDENRIRLGSEVGIVSIVAPAYRPVSPDNASSAKNVYKGLVVGLVLALVYAFIAEFIDDTVKDDSFFRNYGFTILSTVPRVGNNNTFSNLSKSKASIVDPSSFPMITDQLSSGFAESLRTLRTGLDYSRIESPLKTIIISGAAMSEGKSTVCANLGMAFALTGKKTLIVDCDLRRASQHKIFKTNRSNGLTDYLFSQKHTIDNDYLQPTSNENLFILSAGKIIPNPNEVLGSTKMQQLIKELESKFDKVLFDCPPLFLSDAAQLAYFVDGILLVARLNYTDRKPLKEYAINHFLCSKILGIAIIDSNKSNRYAYKKYGYGKYEYVGDAE